MLLITRPAHGEHGDRSGKMKTAFKFLLLCLITFCIPSAIGAQEKSKNPLETKLFTSFSTDSIVLECSFPLKEGIAQKLHVFAHLVQ